MSCEKISTNFIRPQWVRCMLFIKSWRIAKSNFTITNKIKWNLVRDSKSWWRHQMETFSALLTICAENSPVPGEFPAQRPVTRSLDVFFDLCLHKRLNKQSWGWWFETLSHPLWRHCNVLSKLLSELQNDSWRVYWESQELVHFKWLGDKNASRRMGCRFDNTVVGRL